MNLRETLLDAAQQFLMPVDFEVGVESSLHEDARAPEFDGLADFFVNRIEVEDVPLFRRRAFERAIEGAEGAILRAEVWVVNVAIDDVGDGAFRMQAAANGVSLHADSDKVVGVEQVEGLLFGQGHHYPTQNTILAGKAARRELFTPPGGVRAAWGGQPAVRRAFACVCIRKGRTIRRAPKTRSGRSGPASNTDQKISRYAARTCTRDRQE